MKTLYRIFILSILTLSALMSAPGVMAQVQEDQQYDPPADNQAAPLDRQYDQNQNYDQNEPAPRAEDQPLETDPRHEAQANSAPATPDPPARAARLQYMNGSISVQPQGTGDWVSGEVNRPLTNSDNIWADKNSRAELSVGTGVIRIDSESKRQYTGHNHQRCAKAPTLCDARAASGLNESAKQHRRHDATYPSADRIEHGNRERAHLERKDFTHREVRRTGGSRGQEKDA